MFRKYRKWGKSGITNNYLSIKEIEKYLLQGRIFFEEFEEGFALLTYEEGYYRLHYTGSVQGIEGLEPKDKPQLIRYIYTDEQTKEKWIEILGKTKFVLEETSVQIVANVTEISDVREKSKMTSRFLARFGLETIYASEDMYDEIIKLRNEEPVLSIYDFCFETKEETLEDIRNGMYRVVKNINEEVVAAQHFRINNGTLMGEWLAVKEEYKVKYGIGSMMAYQSFLYAIDHNIDLYYGWVDVRNTNSIQYHESVGYKQTNKKADGWILEGTHE